MNDLLERRKAKEGIMMKTITVLLHVCSIIQSKSSKLIANPLFDLASQRTLLYLAPSSYQVLYSSYRSLVRYSTIIRPTCSHPRDGNWYFPEGNTIFLYQKVRLNQIRSPKIQAAAKRGTRCTRFLRTLQKWLRHLLHLEVTDYGYLLI